MISYGGKQVIVTGATGGIGKAVCEKLAEQGAKLSICARNGAELENLRKALAEKTEVYARTADISLEREVAAFFEGAAERFGEFHGMVNLAGLSVPCRIPEAQEEIYDTVMDVNVKGTFLAGKYFARGAANPSIIVNLGSAAARTANANAPLYCAAKAAVNMLSQGMLLQMGAQGIRVTTVNPGGVDTAFWGSRKVDRTKLMSAEDAAEVILFALCSSPKIQIHEIYFESKARF